MSRKVSAFYIITYGLDDTQLLQMIVQKDIDPQSMVGVNPTPGQCARLVEHALEQDLLMTEYRVDLAKITVRGPFLESNMIRWTENRAINGQPTWIVPTTVYIKSTPIPPSNT
jgi:hypothetical protein